MHLVYLCRLQLHPKVFIPHLIRKKINAHERDQIIRYAVNHRIVVHGTINFTV